MSYRILRRLADGGFSEVFEVKDPDSALREVLVLKRLHPEMSARPAVREAFSREGRTLRSLVHPDVVSFRRCFYDDAERVCLLMEKVEGQTLGAWSHGRLDDVESQLRMFGLILEAVDYLHHRPQPVLHLDLKPDNVLVRSTPEGDRPTLIDFGIARGLGEGGLKAFTEPYSAPEQIRGEALSCATDVHALGHLLAEVLGRVAQRLEPERRRALEKVVGKATRPEPRRRFRDAGDMYRAFRIARSRRGQDAVAGDTKRAPKLAPWAAVGLGLVLAVALFSMLASGPDAASRESRQAAVVRKVHQSLESALRSTSHSAVESRFEEARRGLASPHLSAETRSELRRAVAEVRRVVNRPTLSESEREAVSRWLSQQMSELSHQEVPP